MRREDWLVPKLGWEKRIGSVLAGGTPNVRLPFLTGLEIRFSAESLESGLHRFRLNPDHFKIH